MQKLNENAKAAILADIRSRYQGQSSTGSQQKNHGQDNQPKNRETDGKHGKQGQTDQEKEPTLNFPLRVYSQGKNLIVQNIGWTRSYTQEGKFSEELENLDRELEPIAEFTEEDLNRMPA